MSADRQRGPSRILVVQTAFLGDAVLTTPLFRELRRVRPEATICALTTATGRAALGSLPYVDEWLVLDKSWDREGRRSYREVLGRLLHTRFDVAVAAHRSVRTGVILRLSGAPLRVGFRGAPGAWAYNRRIPWAGGRHAGRRYLDLVEPLGGDPERADPRPHLAVSPQAARRLGRLLRRHGVGERDELLAVAPGSEWATKRWLPEGFSRVVATAPERGLVPVLVGTRGERELCRRVACMARVDVPVLAGETSVPELVALMERARIVVANDSGAAHVASAVGTPVVSVFGSTSPAAGYAAFGPHVRVVEHPGLDCRPCGRHGSGSCPLRHFRCMKEVPAAWVLQAVEGLLSAAGRPGSSEVRPPDSLVASLAGSGAASDQSPARVAPG